MLMDAPEANKERDRRVVGRVIALVPALNEESRIASTIQGLYGAVPRIEVVVVDDGSTDETGVRARAAGAIVKRMPRNMGKGNALNEAFRALDLDDQDYLLFIDADLGATSGEAANLLSPITAGEAEMTVASFQARTKGGFGLATGLARWGIRRLSGFEATTPLSGQRAMRVGLFRAVGGLESGYGMEVGLTIDVLRCGGRIREVAVEMSHNETGRDLAGWRHRGNQFQQIARVLFKKRFTSKLSARQ